LTISAVRIWIAWIIIAQKAFWAKRGKKKKMINIEDSNILKVLPKEFKRKYEGRMKFRMQVKKKMTRR
jgi:hypothetical protein